MKKYIRLDHDGVLVDTAPGYCEAGQRALAFGRLERWQTSYLIVHAVWAWTVALVFPPVFGFA